MTTLQDLFAQELAGEAARHEAMDKAGDDHTAVFMTQARKLEARFHQVLSDEIALALADGACLHMVAWALNTLEPVAKELTAVTVLATKARLGRG